MKTIFNPGDWVVPKNLKEEMEIVRQAALMDKPLPLNTLFRVESVYDQRTNREFLVFDNCDMGFYSDRFKPAFVVETPLEDWL